MILPCIEQEAASDSVCKIMVVCENESNVILHLQSHDRTEDRVGMHLAEALSLEHVLDRLFDDDILALHTSINHSLKLTLKAVSVLAEVATQLNHTCLSLDCDQTGVVFDCIVAEVKLLFDHASTILRGDETETVFRLLTTISDNRW